ncbi:MAG: hypothetical protein FWG66_10890 [Spirochaetes bacterium]|nr:hypothetical protein [Spirochaetota bacterium]
MTRWLTDFTYKIEDMATDDMAVYRFVSNYYRDVVKREAVLANVNSDDNMLCIGGGLCPFSAILFHQITGANVTVVDNNMACIPKARQMIDRFGMGDKVFALCQDGGNMEIDLTQYSVIHLALQVAPMDYVFSQIERQAAPGTRLLARVPKKILYGFFGSLPSSSLACCPYVAHKSRNIGSTLLHIKQVVAHEEKTNNIGAFASPIADACSVCAVST